MYYQLWSREIGIESVAKQKENQADDVVKHMSKMHLKYIQKVVAGINQFCNQVPEEIAVLLRDNNNRDAREENRD